MYRIIRCDEKCEGCYYEWRNAQYNPDCLLIEMLDFIDKKNKNITTY